MSESEQIDPEAQAFFSGLFKAIGWIFAFFTILILSWILSDTYRWWAKGHAVSAWVKAKHGIDVPWYSAGYLPVDARDFSVEVSGLHGGEK